MKNRILWWGRALMACVLMSGMAHADSFQFKEGQDFLTISSPINVAGISSPYIVEYLWLGCSHCQALNPLLAKYEKATPDVTIVRRPAIGRDRWVFDAHVFYALQASGHAELIYPLMAFYHDFAASERRLPDRADLKTFLRQHQLDAQTFYRDMDSEATLEKLSLAYQDQNSLAIKGVPAFLVAGKYMVNLGAVSHAKDPNAYFTALLNYLLDKASKK
ncbi:DsbA family protein [Shewanella sp. YIC-542]|uniref:DsbA family protein n=1 Tax=Shewanella mytili TaxID=3377111 RepID=UPI00398F8477